MTKKVLLINQGNSDNVGDRLINDTLSKLIGGNYCLESKSLEINYPDTPIEVAVEQRLMHTGHINTKFFLKSLINKLLRFLMSDYLFFYFKAIYKMTRYIKNSEFDIYVIGGGELLKSNHFFIPYMDAWTKMIKNYWPKKRLILFGVSSDQHFTLREEKRLHTILKRFDFVNVRDNATLNVLYKDFAIKAHMSPDCVFVYNYFNQIKIEKENKMLVSVFDYHSLPPNSEWKTKEEYFAYWFKLIKKNHSKGLTIKFIYTCADDALCTLEFYKMYRKLLECIDINMKMDYKLDDIVIQIANAESIITGRMHAMILAKQYNTKIVPFIFKNKIACFVDEWINREYNMETVLDEIQEQIERIIR